MLNLNLVRRKKVAYVVHERNEAAGVGERPSIYCSRPCCAVDASSSPRSLLCAAERCRKRRGRRYYVRRKPHWRAVRRRSGEP